MTHSLSLGMLSSRIFCMNGHLLTQSFSCRGYPSEKILLSKVLILQNDSDLKLLTEPKLPSSNDVTLFSGIRRNGSRKMWTQGY